MVVTGAAPALQFESPVVAQTRLRPRARPEPLARAALTTRRLSSPAKLAVLAGPAGSGKSTLLAQCRAADPHPVWLSLGPEDNDPVVLWWWAGTTRSTTWMITRPGVGG